MSGVAVVNYLLSNAASVIAVVPAARILTGPLPLQEDDSVAVELPAITISQISGTEWNKANKAESSGSQFRTERVQVTVHATTYASKKAILNLVRTACTPKPTSPVNSVKVDSIQPDGEGPDLDDPQSGMYEQSRDFLVRWHT